MKSGRALPQLQANGKSLKKSLQAWKTFISCDKMVEGDEMFLFDTDVITNVLKKTCKDSAVATGCYP